MQNESTYIDGELLQHLNRGDEVALTLIYKKFWRPLFMYVFSILKDKAACEDIVQDVFLYLWEKRGSYKVSTSLRGYLFTVARHLIFHYIEMRKVRMTLFKDLEEKLQTPSVELKIDEKEIHHKICIIVASLPPRCREVYLLSREEYQSGKNIATILNISSKTVENQITKALRTLRKGLADRVNK